MINFLNLKLKYSADYPGDEREWLQTVTIDLDASAFSQLLALLRLVNTSNLDFESFCVLKWFISELDKPLSKKV